jgi:hypothetical protein
MSTQTEQSQFNFLDSIVERMLLDAGLGALSEETRNMYLPQFVSEAEIRLGEAIEPYMTPEFQTELGRLMGDQTVTPEQVRALWTSHVPEFDSIVERTLVSFRDEVKNILATLS